ncbi:asparagine synthase (glutamine-hydrolyzing) [Ancylobacter sp. WKF20]|uniref:asparagine synthase (glutamine-hydrolyzing) n=1 Tax=Ancylobacter sp. WKF20 TaxID=3039801 RepID=UPI0024344B46|nr:asparagine synthase (glutamine-hydrolyzing) [Ancylobacter sp. WKF20]WGD30040.1 asparagine synthase (glutamine-hydrolyzing) [Ancylobacter sp. WKF20]
MCGIAGFVGPGTGADLRAMTDALQHRGPDDSGTYEDRSLPGAPVQLGFRRLAIVDLEGGRQPMQTADGALVVVFNGEIYNHVELRAALEQSGHRFETDHSDTEVLLHGYRQWGEGLVERLSGMFAFCVYDRRAGRLLLARDHFGKKPLFYARTREGFVFASEATALLRHPSVSDAVDAEAVLKYFAYGFVPAPRSIYRDIAKLPGGCLMSVDLATGQMQTRRYWEYRMAVDDPPPGSIEDWAEELRHLLGQAVERRLAADVPLGFFLSGGIDSTAVVALAAARRDPASMKTYTIGFNEPSYDESAIAAAMARHYGTDHHATTLDLDLAARMMPQLLRGLDDPIADASILPTHLLCGFARRDVTVALSGDGGDELFAGYDTFAALRTARAYHRLVPGWAHRGISAAAEYLPRSDANMSLDFKIRRALRGLGHAPAHWMPSWLGPASLEDMARLFGTTLDPHALYEEAEALWASGASPHDVDRSLEYYGRFYLGENLLIKADRASMLASLEVRSPFLDRDLVAFASRLPASVKMRGGVRKWILKKAMAPLVPAQILDRPKKGFGIPVSRWLRHMELPSRDASARLGLDHATLEGYWSDHRKGRADHRGLLWAAVVLATMLDRP